MVPKNMASKRNPCAEGERPDPMRIKPLPFRHPLPEHSAIPEMGIFSDAG